MPNRKLKIGLGAIVIVVSGFSIPIIAVRFQQSKV
jgi:hypothetical protein